MHTGPVDGNFTDDDWKQSQQLCRDCGAASVFYKAWESSCGGYEDYKYKCDNCGKTWWVEGPDS